MACIQSGLIKIVLSNKLQDLVVEIEAISGEGEDMFGKLRGVRVRVRVLRW